MKKDIEIPEVKQVHIAITSDTPEIWSIYILNRSSNKLENTMIVSHGFGIHEGEEVKTSTLRHSIGTVSANSTSAIEKIDPSLFHLTHEYWLTFYVGNKIYDKKFIFNPGTLSKENLSYIKELDKEGIIST